ncbi:Fe-S cluster assembly protein SufD [Lacipirellula sp.]|uniref:Fe-S cluster assembly protein SufD n=1 Tax=Lacipirellula sp. TaxID=2691419 RepID=UPI003D0BA410
MSNTLLAAGFAQEAFDSFLASRNEPGWLLDLRRAAWARFCELGMPARNDEEWVRTDIRLFKLDRFGFPAVPPIGSDMPRALLAEGVELGGSAVTSDSHVVGSQLAEKWAAKGVLFGDIATLVAEHGDVLRPFFERNVVNPNHDKFSALNAAAWAGGALLYVPRRVTIDEPLHALSALSDGGVDLNKTLVILEEGADATLLSETASISENGGGFHCGSIELIVEPSAKLRYVNLQNWGNQVWHFAHQKAHIASRARLQWTIGALGSRLAKVNQHVALTGEDAEAQVNGVMFTQGRQHLSYNTHQHHMAAHCRSDLLYKAALQDDSRTVWRGMIKVDKPAQRTDAYQRNDNLMLSRTARADSIPGLEIEADDVRCTHGSTSGRVDEQQVFYAMTRGYTRQEAVRMIVEGFFQQVFDRIPIESVSEALGEAIGQRVRDI